jgi:hypothetical protein
MPDTMTIADFVRTRGITIACEQIDERPDRHKDDEPWEADHWKCVLRRANVRRILVIYFSKGRGHHGAEPTADEVLDSLSLDASGVVNGETFEDWCDNFGYDTDSRKAERTFKQCRKIAGKLLLFFDSLQEFKVLVEECEHL